MRSNTKIARVAVGLFAIVLIFGSSVPLASAEVTPSLPDLVLREVRTKGTDEMIVLKATKDVDLNEYWLSYAAPGETPAPDVQLDGRLNAGEVAMMTSGGVLPTCDADLLIKFSSMLTDGGGTLGVWHKTFNGQSLVLQLVDSYTWQTKDTTVTPNGSYGPIAFRNLESPESGMEWYKGSVKMTEEGCELVPVSGAATQLSTLDPTVHEVVVKSPSADDQSVPEGPGHVQITELLPNPSGTGNDDTDEYIELYNPGQEPFDIGGYRIETGTTTKHEYEIPAGTVVEPQSYRVFYASETGLTLSNTAGAAAIYDANGEMIAETDVYESAKDGQTWADINGVWQWTSEPTPAAPNVIGDSLVAGVVKSIATKAKTAAKTPAKLTAAKTVVPKKAVAAKKTTAPKAKTTKTKKTKAPNTAKLSTQRLDERKTRSIHPLVLALVAGAAVAYGLYEYRHDLANKVYNIRSNRAARRAVRK